MIILFILGVVLAQAGALYAASRFGELTGLLYPNAKARNRAAFASAVLSAAALLTAYRIGVGA